MPSTAHQKKSQMETLLAERKRELVNLLHDLAGLQTSVAQLQGHITSIESIIQVLCAEIEAESASDLVKKNSRRNPMEMIRDEFKGMKLGDIAEQVLEDSDAPLNTTELTHLIYDTYNSSELSRARNSLSAELRTGAKGDSPRWQKIGRNAYKSLDFAQEEAA